MDRPSASPCETLAERYQALLEVTQAISVHRELDDLFVPLTTAVRRLGTMGFCSLEKGAYSDTDVEFLCQIANQIAATVDNVLHHQDLIHDRDRLRLLLEVTESIASHRDLEALFRDLAKRLPSVVQFEFIALILHDPLQNVMKTHTLGTAEGESIPPGFELPIEES